MANELMRSMRSRLQTALPQQAFLKRDRESALFVTNAPIFNPAIKAIPGFILIPTGKLLRLLPDDGWIAALEQTEAPDQLATGLARFRGLPIDGENLLLCVQGLKLIDMDASAPGNDVEAFDRSLRQRAALALRGAASGGGLYAAAIINHEIKSIKENEI